MTGVVVCVALLTLLRIGKLGTYVHDVVLCCAAIVIYIYIYANYGVPTYSIKQNNIFLHMNLFVSFSLYSLHILNEKED